MNASMKMAFQDGCWGDSFDSNELKRLLAMVDSLPREEAIQMSRPNFLRKLLQLGPAGSITRTKEQHMSNTPSESAELTGSNKIKAILWDNDGVLVDSESAFFKLTQRVFRDHKLELGSAFWATNFLGKGRRTSEIAQGLGMGKDEAIRLATHRDILWQQRIKDSIPLCDGVEDALASLGSRYRMAVVTGAPRRHFEDVHYYTSIMRYFETTITADDCAKVKPEPDSYLMAAARMGLHPSECVVIEDSPRGMCAALAAGMRCILLKTPLTDMAQCQQATWVVESIAEIQDILESVEVTA